MSPATLCLNDDAFGPSVRGCRGDFDFTRKFELIFFDILPASIFIALAITRAAVLAQKHRIVGGTLFQYAKVASLTVYTAVQFAFLILVVTRASRIDHGLSLAASAIVFVASFSTIALSYLEHSRSQRPSTLIGIYFFLTLLFDIAQSRTLWLARVSAYDSTLARLLTASVAIKLGVLCLEATPKTRWIRWDAAEHSPEESSGVFSLGVYFWVNKIFRKGYGTMLGIDDLYPLDIDLSAQRLHDNFINVAQFHRYSSDPKWGLVRDLCKSLPGPFLMPVAPRVAMVGFLYCQPFFISTILQYLDDTSDTRRNDLGYGLIGAAVIIYTGIAVSQGFYNYYTWRAVYSIRGTLVGIIYRKTADMKVTTADDSAALTLMSTEVEVVVRAGINVHDVWGSVLEVAIGCWLLEQRLGAAFVSPLAVIVVTAAMMAFLMKYIPARQANWMGKIQNRVGLTSNAIANMKLYKISGITGPVASLIQSLRVGELKVGNKYRAMQTIAAILGFAPMCLSPLLAFAVTSHTLNVTTIFTSISYILLVTTPLMMLFQSVPGILAAWTSLQRIQKFVVSQPRKDFRIFAQESSPVQSDDSGGLIVDTSEETEKDNHDGELAFSIEHGSFGWGGEKMTLSDISAKIPSGKLTLVIGPVASGKSTFCKVLLGEMPVHEGIVTAYFPKASIGYCEQTPFLYNHSLKGNIIGHLPFNQKRYDEVINATLLAVDVALLPQGHDTKIGSNGIMLSGGQKQRVSVARSLYADSQILIFDDILSGLDTDTESELFRRVFGPEGIVRQRNATAVVCTHSIRHLPSTDHIISLDLNGTVVEQGTFDDLMADPKYVHSLGVKAAANNVADSDASVDEEQPAPPPGPVSNAISSVLNDKARQLGDWSVYSHYMKSTSKLSVVLVVVAGLSWGFCDNFSNVWLKFWSENTFDKPFAFYIAIYALLRVTQMGTLLVAIISVFITVVTISGRVLHLRAITTVVTAPLSFFSSTDTGTVINLFSQDMTLIDGELPLSVINCAVGGSECFGALFVVASATPYMAIGYPLLFAIIYALQKFYLRTSRQMRLLDLEAKSPLYGHFIDTIKGIVTIRAFDWTQADIDHNDNLLDASQRPAYLLAIIQQWLSLTVQLIVAGLAVLLVALATQLRTDSGLIGAGLVTLLNLGQSISHLIMSYTLLETSIGAISRLRTFSNTVIPEDLPGEDIEPPEDWPQNGRIDIQDVSATYGSSVVESDGKSEGESSSIMVIKDLTLTIAPGQKVAICGRTGSGKSSLMLLLLRLLDPLPCCAENMEIDGVPFHSIDRATLRKRIIAIPQDAVFLPDGSTIKSNIDPLEAATNEECLSVLENVRLRGFVDDRGGLQAGMSADDLSAGQKQLFSLGRAMVRKRVRDRLTTSTTPGEKGQHRGGVLLLDEVSSSVDHATDRAMQEIIREEFRSYTIVMVSHRLEMVMDFFDRVVVLDKGALVETGSPRALAETPGSRFGELWAMGNHDSLT